ncbi:MAG: Uma2 family endonuclease [Blastocatellia bacterium]|nr:Uma2 family endonuclease [Blastocatellia bacterium]
MSLPQARIRFTEEEYLKLERESEEKYEYLDGEIYAMAGEQQEHNEICVNLVAELRNQLKGSPCRTLSKDIKVRTGPEPIPGRSPQGFYSYPDVLIVCGERRFHDKQKDVLLNPQVIIEVLSKSTAEADRGEKFKRYRQWLPSLTDYLLVAQDCPLIEHYRRHGADEWVLATFEGLDARVPLPSVDCALLLQEVYDGLAFPPEQR